MQKRRILAAAFAVSAAVTLMVAGPASASVIRTDSMDTTRATTAARDSHARRYEVIAIPDQ